MSNEGTVAEGTVETNPAESYDDVLSGLRQAALQDFSQENAQDEQPTTEATKETQTPKNDGSQESQDGPAGDDDQPRTYTRRELARELERVLAERDSAKKTADDATSKLDEYVKEDEELAKEVMQVLGTDEQYRALTLAARNGDKEAGQLLNEYDANRKFFAKLQKQAARNMTAYFTGQLVEKAKEAGLPEDMVFSGTPEQIVSAAYKAGKESAEGPLKEEITALKTELEQAKAVRAGSRGLPLSGGKGTSGDPLESMFGPDGQLTEDAIRKVKSGLYRDAF